MANVDAEIIRMVEEAKVAPVRVGKTSNLYADLGFDSLSFIRLLMRIEEAFSISFGIAEMDSCLQIDQLIIRVKDKLGERGDHD